MIEENNQEKEIPESNDDEESEIVQMEKVEEV